MLGLHPCTKDASPIFEAHKIHCRNCEFSICKINQARITISGEEVFHANHGLFFVTDVCKENPWKTVKTGSPS